MSAVIYPTFLALPKITNKVLQSTRLKGIAKTRIHSASTDINIKRNYLNVVRRSFVGDLFRYRYYYKIMQGYPRIYPFQLSYSLVRMSLWVETVYYLVSSMFDISTQITKEIYPQRNLPWPSFTSQMERLIESNLDLRLSAFLKRMKLGYDEFKGRRDMITHYSTSLLNNLTPKEPVGKFLRPKMTQVPISKAVSDACELLYRFLRFYDGHVSKFL